MRQWGLSGVGVVFPLIDSPNFNIEREPHAWDPDFMELSVVL